MPLFAALKRRNVLRVGAAYILVAWLVIQVVETVFPAFGYDDSATRVVVIVFAIGLIPTVVGAWAFQFTPDGPRLDKGTDHNFVSSQKASRKLDWATIAVLVLGISYFAVDKFLPEPDRTAERLDAIEFNPELPE
jgi:predicted membrane channel-forming protein YqfA (hemolysin III family)